MPKTTLFIGSALAARSQAKAFVQRLTSPTVQFIPWWEAFPAGRTLLEGLDRVRCRVDGAVLLFAPEAKTPNLNVLFEFGYFYGKFGKKRTAMLKYGDFYLPSDFGGYVHIHGSKFFKRGAATPIAKRTELEFKHWLAEF